MVDLLGHVGHLDEVKILRNSIPIKPNAIVIKIKIPS